MTHFDGSALIGEWNRNLLTLHRHFRIIPDRGFLLKLPLYRSTADSNLPNKIEDLLILIRWQHMRVVDPPVLYCLGYLYDFTDNILLENLL